MMAMRVLRSVSAGSFGALGVRGRGFGVRMDGARQPRRANVCLQKLGPYGDGCREETGGPMQIHPAFSDLAFTCRVAAVLDAVKGVVAQEL